KKCRPPFGRSARLGNKIPKGGTGGGRSVIESPRRHLDMVTNYDGEQVEIPETLPMLPVRDIVVFPYMIIPLFVGRDSSIRSVEEALARSDRLILLASQKDISDEHPSPEGIYKTGTVAMIMRMRKLPDGRIKILTQGLCKAQINEFTQTQPFYQVN